MDIIHMNGRTYNVALGRFMQADPHVQSPSNMQNYNRYAYVMNNPMSMTDPSGYFFKWLAKKSMKHAGHGFAAAGLVYGGVSAGLTNYWLYDRAMNSNGTAAVVNVGLNFIPGCQVWCSAAFSAQRAYYQTGSLGAAFHAGGRSAAISGAFMAIGGAFDGEAGSGFWAKDGLGHIATHAAAGGIISDVQGGKFGHGFFAAGITKGFQASGKVSSDMITGTIQSAVVGGTASAISGGKFANGATTAAFQYLYNYAQNKTDINREKEIAKIRENLNLNKQQSRMVLNKFYSNDEPLVDNDITSAHIALATDVLARGIHATQAFLAISRVQAAIPFLGAPRAVQIFQTGVDLYSGGVSDWKDFFTGTPNYSNPRIANVIIPSVRFHHEKEYDELRGRY